ncbi:hypothetical protein ACFQ1I_46885 [Kitasatospora arboriphila]
MRLARGAYRRAWRHRRHLAPLYSAAALAAYGQAIVLAPHGGVGALAADLALPAGVAACGPGARRSPTPTASRASCTPTARCRPRPTGRCAAVNCCAPRPPRWRPGPWSPRCR